MRFGCGHFPVAQRQQLSRFCTCHLHNVTRQSMLTSGQYVDVYLRLDLHRMLRQMRFDVVCELGEAAVWVDRVECWACHRHQAAT